MKQPYSKEDISFSFGENWINYLGKSDEVAFTAAMNDIENWLGKDSIRRSRVLDLGSGSGIHSLALHQLGAAELISVDYDPNSVTATSMMHTRAGKPENWKVMQGSALDKTFMQSLSLFDIVYSWGVLHHTGSMWEAVENAASAVKPNGLFLLSIYVKGPNYQRDLDLKIRYNKLGWLGKKWMLYTKMIIPLMISHIHWRQNPFKWNVRGERGMFVYYDMIDWLGGLPYEVASKEEIDEKMRSLGFRLEKIKEYREGFCNVYLYRKQ